MTRFERLREDFATRKIPLNGKKYASDVLEKEYSGMVAFDFSRDFLAHCTQDCVMVPLDGITWSDLGRPGRVVDVLRRVGYRPNFPVEMADETGHRL